MNIKPEYLGRPKKTNKISVGDAVRIRDWSYNIAIHDDFLMEGRSKYKEDLIFVVLALNCVLPTDETYGPANKQNDVILVSSDDYIYFSRLEFLDKV